LSSAGHSASKDEQSDVRQRCGCQLISSKAESSCAPSASGQVENVYSFVVCSAICKKERRTIRSSSAQETLYIDDIQMKKIEE
jgi:hypothetical protein